MRCIQVWGIIVIAIFSFGAGAAKAQQEMEPELPPDPKVMAILDGLGDTSSAVLPPIKTLGDWNDVNREHSMQKRGPSGRDYTNKAVWMPDRKRAFFCGANHGSPHRINDAWEYDLPSNTWVQLFTPDPNNARGVIEIVDAEVPGTGEKVKWVQTKRGGPTHYGHTWWALCYDATMGAALWMNVGIGSNPRTYIEKTLGEDAPAYKGPPMWAFLPYEKKWKMVYTPAPFPSVAYAKQMEYVPDLGGPLFMSGGWNGSGTWLYDSKTNTWKKLLPKSKDQPDNESLTCYDGHRRLILAQGDQRAHCSTHIYDIKANIWTRVLRLAEKESDTVPVGHDGHCVMFFDSHANVALLYEKKRPDTVWSFDPDLKKWTANKVVGDPCPKGKIIGYYDAPRNVLVINVGANTWVYRHKRVAK
jgi:hypothetical protein